MKLGSQVRDRRAALAAGVTILGVVAIAAGGAGRGLVDEFNIGLEEPVSPGVPGPGAGHIEEPGAMDIYRLTVDPGTEVYFDELSGPCGIRWRCEDAQGLEIFSDVAMCSLDPGTRLLELGGEYTITVFGAGGATGTYSFVVWEVNPPEHFVIGLEEPVSPGVPGPGAGTIEEPGAMDIYRLTVDPGTEVYFDELSGPCGIRWRCEDAQGLEIFSDVAMCSLDPGTRLLELGGEYTITVFGGGGATGTYSFVVWEVNPPEHFVIGLEEPVSPGVPGAGAGHIEEAGAMDIYRLTVDPGTEVYFDELSGPCSIRWRCEDAQGLEIFSDVAMCSLDPGTRLLEPGGEYTITVFGVGGGTGTYSFVVWDVEPPQSFQITFDQVVSEGVPGPGAGHIEEPGAVDVYTFDAGAGAVACFEELSGPCGLAWTCVDAQGTEIFRDPAMCSENPGKRVLEVGGTYTITVDGPGGGIGTYSFVVNTGNAADVNGDCAVDVIDLLQVLGGWGPCPAPCPPRCPPDVNGDCIVDVLDLLLVLTGWGG